MNELQEEPVYMVNGRAEQSVMVSTEILCLDREKEISSSHA